MLVVWVGTVLALGMTANSLIKGQALTGTDGYGFELASSLILFFTLWFANFAEAIAEARGRGQAASLKATRRDLTAQLLRESEEPKAVSASQLKAGDKVLVEAGQFVPADGEIVVGVATINESALTGESAPVLREAGTDHSGVIAGTKVLSGTITVLVTAEAGHSFLDKMISLVEGTNRQKTPNELALTVLLAALTLVFLIAVATLPAMAAFVGIELDLLMLIALVVCLIPTTIAGLLPAIGIAGMNRALAAMWWLSQAKQSKSQGISTPYYWIKPAPSLLVTVRRPRFLLCPVWLSLNWCVVLCCAQCRTQHQKVSLWCVWRRSKVLRLKLCQTMLSLFRSALKPVYPVCNWITVNIG
jgi:K+-transporting ATPase ATPase B chain